MYVLVHVSKSIFTEYDYDIVKFADSFHINETLGTGATFNCHQWIFLLEGGWAFTSRQWAVFLLEGDVAEIAETLAAVQVAVYGSHSLSPEHVLFCLVAIAWPFMVDVAGDYALDHGRNVSAQVVQLNVKHTLSVEQVHVLGDPQLKRRPVFSDGRRADDDNQHATVVHVLLNDFLQCARDREVTLVHTAAQTVLVFQVRQQVLDDKVAVFPTVRQKHVILVDDLGFKVFAADQSLAAIQQGGGAVPVLVGQYRTDDQNKDAAHAHSRDDNGLENLI